MIRTGYVVPLCRTLDKKKEVCYQFGKPDRTTAIVPFCSGLPPKNANRFGGMLLLLPPFFLHHLSNKVKAAVLAPRRGMLTRRGLPTLCGPKQTHEKC